MQLAISARKTLAWLLSITAVLVIIHLVFQYYFYFHQVDTLLFREFLIRFHVGEELSVPTVFNVLLLLLAAVLIGTIAYATKQWKGRHIGRWALLGFLFLYFSIDEGASLHEIADLLRLQDALGLESDLFVFGWVVLALGFLAAFAVLFARFWGLLPRRTRALMAIAAACYLGGALIVEMFSGEFRAVNGHENFTYAGTFAAIEEGLEMTGLNILIYALLDYLYRSQLKLFLSASE